MGHAFLGQDFVFTFKHPFVNAQVPGRVQEPPTRGEHLGLTLVPRILLLRVDCMVINTHTHTQHINVAATLHGEPVFHPIQGRFVTG